MKNYKTFWACICLLTLPLLMYAGGPKYEEVKEYSEVVDVDPKGLLEIDNSFGNLNIITWDKDVVDIYVEVRVSGKDKDAVMDALERIEVEFDLSREAVRARTQIEEQNSWWSGWWNKANVDKQINYTIRMPSSMKTDLTNDYGTIIIDILTGPSRINCDYGTLDIGSLVSDDNQLTFDYTRKSVIEFLNEGELNANYSEISIHKASVIRMKADYTNVEVKEAERVAFDGDYGDFTGGVIGQIEIDCDYLGVKIDKLLESIKSTQDYGSLKIYSVGPNFKFIDASNDYGNVNLQMDRNSAFQYELSTSYGGIRLDKDLEVIYEEDEMFSEEVRGFYKNRSAKANIRVDVSYSNVSLSFN